MWRAIRQDERSDGDSPDDGRDNVERRKDGRQSDSKGREIAAESGRLRNTTTAHGPESEVLRRDRRQRSVSTTAITNRTSPLSKSSHPLRPPDWGAVSTVVG